MNLTVEDIIASYNTQVTELTQKLVLAEARAKALERRVAELEGQPAEEDA